MWSAGKLDSRGAGPEQSAEGASRKQTEHLEGTENGGGAGGGWEGGGVGGMLEAREVSQVELQCLEEPGQRTPDPTTTPRWPRGVWPWSGCGLGRSWQDPEGWKAAPGPCGGVRAC